VGFATVKEDGTAGSVAGGRILLASFRICSLEMGREKSTHGGNVERVKSIQLLLTAGAGVAEI